MTKVKCEMTSCSHNSSCCLSPCEGHDYYCTKDDITINLDENHMVQCEDHTMELEKPIECVHCQIAKYGFVKLEKPIDFEIIETDESDF